MMRNILHFGGIFRDLRRHRLIIGGLFLLSVVLSTAFVSNLSAHAAQTVPYKINFQGYLTDASGAKKPNGLYNMRLSLFTTSTGGTAIWTETRETTARVQVTNGMFNIQLGDVTGLAPTTIYPLFLEVELPTPATATCSTAGCAAWTEGAMTPRSPLASSPYAMNADTLDGIDGINFARKDTANTFTNETSFNGQVNFNFDANFATDMYLTFNQLTNGSAYVTQATGTAAALENHRTDGLQIKVSSWRNGSTNAQNTTALATLAVNDNIRGVVDNGVIYPDNLIANPGFEFGCNGWTGICQGTTNQTAASGLSSLEITQANATAVYDARSRMVATQPGDQFFTSLKVKTSATTTGGGGLYVIFYDANGSLVGYSNGDWTNPGTSWATKSWVHTTPAGATYASLSTTVRGNGTTAGVWNFDDISMYKMNKSTPMSFKNDVDSSTSFQVQRASGENMFVADTANNAIKIGGGDTNQDGGATLMVLDNKNTSGDPTGVNGAMYYNSNTSKFRCYEKGGWKDCITPSSGSSRTNYGYFNDFMNINRITTSGTMVDEALTVGFAGTGANVNTTLSPVESGHPGIARLNSGTAATAIIGYVNTTSVTPFTTLQFGNGVAWTAGGNIRHSAQSNSTNNFITRLGFINTNSTAAAPSNGCFFSYNFAASTGNYQANCVRANTASTCDTGIAVVANEWRQLSVTVNSDASIATFVIDDVPVCTISTNIPTTEGTGFGFNLQKTAGTTSVAMDLDYFEVNSTGTFSR